jgi:hypothetical protein
MKYIGRRASDLQRSGRHDVQLAQTRRLPSNAYDPIVRIAAVSLLQDRGLVEGQGEHARPAAYVCRACACEAAVMEHRALEQLPGVD